MPIAPNTPTLIEQTNSGVYQQASSATATAVVVDRDGDGLVDGVKVTTRGQKADLSTDVIATDTAEGFAAAQAVLNQHGLQLVESGGQEFITQLGQDLQLELGSFASALAQASSGGNHVVQSHDLQSRWAEFMGKIAQDGPVDVNALVQWVLREAYMDNTKDLQFYAQKVQFYNDLKKLIRDEVTQARKFQADMTAKESTIRQSVRAAHSTWTDDQVSAAVAQQMQSSYGVFHTAEFSDKPHFDPATGKMVPATPADTGAVQNKEQLDAYIKGLEEKLNSVGDDAQLANVDLQNMLQKQQQTLQMMSNISKMLNDTAMAIIRKIGG